jgi:hypothetical protein
MSELMGHVASAFGGASGLFTTLKEGANALREGKNLELYERMLSVYGDVMELVEKNRELYEENQALKAKFLTKENLSFDGERYWINKEGQKDGPFCSTCWDVDSKLVRMRTYKRYSTNETDYTCDYCGRHRSKGHEKSRSGD